MASICFDKSTGWWSVRYYVSPEKPWAKKTLCKHPTAWSRSKPPRKPPIEVRDLAAPYVEQERLARSGAVVPSRAMDLAAYIRGYLATYRLTHRPRSIAQAELVTGRFLEWCADRKVATIQDVTVHRCDEWLAHRLTEGAQRSTVTSERGYLSPIWKQARKHRVIAENPWELATTPGKPKDDTIKYWTEPELRRLFAACDGWARDFAMLAGNTGVRVGALLGLRWGDVDFRAETLTVPTHLSKSGRAYSVPLSAEAHTVLAARNAAAADIGPDSRVFPQWIDGRKITSKRAWKVLGAAARKAGIRDFGSYSHALRHSFAVSLAGQGNSLRIIQELLGHQSIRSTERYAKIAPSKTQEVMGRFRIGGDEGPDRHDPSPSGGPS